MRYDEFDDYRRSSRSSSRSASRSGDRNDNNRSYREDSYSDRGYYDRGYGDRGYGSSRGYSDRSYSRSGYEDYDRYGSSQDYSRRGADRSSSRSSDYYGSRSSGRERYDDFDLRDWERTAPKWDERSGRSSGSRDRDHRSSNRSYSSGHRSSYHTDRERSGERRSSSRSSGSRSGERRSSGSRSGSASSRHRSAPQSRIPILPIAIGVVVIIVTILLISSLLGGGNSDYKITFESDAIVPGETTTASITGLVTSEEYDIQWFSSDPNVVSLKSDGTTCLLTANSVGTVNIGATITDKSGETNISATLIVAETAPGVVKISMATESVEIYAGETYKARATVVMESSDMSPAKLTWESNDPSVARVDSNGEITAREVGMAIIKASAGGQTAEIAVTVVENPNNKKHDASQTTGTEPEEGAVLPEDDQATGGTTGTGATGNTGGTTTGDGSGTTGGTADTGNTGTTADTGTDDSQEASGDAGTDQEAQASQ